MLDVRFVAASDAPVRVQLCAPGAWPAPHAAAARADGFGGDVGETCLLRAAQPALLLVGLGEGAADIAAYRAAGSAAAAALAAFPAACLDLAGHDAQAAAEFVLAALLRAAPGWQMRKTADEDAPRLARLDCIGSEDLARLWPSHAALARAVLLTRELVTLPANYLNPATYLDHLAPLLRAGITAEVIDAARLREMGAGGIIAVGQAAATPPALLVLRWAGQGGAPVLLCGKGITFDTGGICIKPADGMWEMRSDMAGSAACAGAIYACALGGITTPVTAVLALAENAIGAAAYRPGDVLHMLNGTSVEVVDTDAEGRLVLADALVFARRQKPRAIIDLATLTGSIVTALGHVHAGIFANDDTLARAVLAAGAAVGEPVWRMPIDASHRRVIDSDIADLRHCSPERMQPDACQAAAFLREFVGHAPWVHIDIAGVDSWEDADATHPKGARGYGVRLLYQLISAHLPPLVPLAL